MSLNQYEKEALDAVYSVLESASVQQKALDFISHAEDAIPTLAAAGLASMKKSQPGGLGGVFLSLAEEEAASALTAWLKTKQPQEILAWVNGWAAKEFKAIGG